jgi:ADP-ribosylglycohydrolase
MDRQDGVALAVARARGSLLGLAVGDAFGETISRDPLLARRIARRLPPVRRPWRWTDDTAMAISIVEALERHGTVDPDVLAGAFARRFELEPGRGYASGAASVLTRIAAGGAWPEQAAALFGGRGSYGNGAAMRAAPIGAYFAPDLERVAVEARRSAAPTHAHPDGAAGAVAVAVAAALATSSAAAACAGGEALLDGVIRHTPDSPTRERLRRAAELGLDFDVRFAGEELGTGCNISARDTVPFCVWVAARHLDCYEDAVWTATSQVGDRDTLGAIVGGIVAAATGAEGIPLLWRASLEPLPASVALEAL